MAPPLTGAERALRYRRRHPGRDAHARNARRVWVGEIYVGTAPTPEIAQAINDETRREFHDRKNQSTEEG